MKLKIILGFLFIFMFISTVNAHGVHIENDKILVIADNDTGVLAKKTVDSLGLQNKVVVYKFYNVDDVKHELEHCLTNKSMKILVTTYQNETKSYVEDNNLTDRVLICSADSNDISNALRFLSSEKDNSNFLVTFLEGSFIGLILGIGIGVFLMKLKLNK